MTFCISGISCRANCKDYYLPFTKRLIGFIKTAQLVKAELGLPLARSVSKIDTLNCYKCSPDPSPPILEKKCISYILTRINNYIMGFLSQSHLSS